MKIGSGKSVVEFGGMIEPGDYIFQWQEGIGYSDKNVSDKITDERVTFMLTAKAIDVATKIVDSDKEPMPGDRESIGRSVVTFLSLQKKDGEVNTFGQRDFGDFIFVSSGGVCGKLEKKYPDGTPITDRKFLDDVALNLPGTKFGGRVAHEDIKAQDGQITGKRPKFIMWWKLAGEADQIDVEPQSDNDDNGFD